MRARKIGWVSLVVMAVGAGELPSAYAAQPGGLALELGTDVPVAIAARARYEFVPAIRVALSLGLLPGPYVDGINSVVVGLGGYDDATAELIRHALDTSLLVGPAVGYRPFANWGFYAEAGYRWAGLGGDASAAELIAGLTGEPVPEGRLPRARTFTAESSLHLATIELGYEWLFDDRWLVRADVGGLFTLSASNHITPDYEPAAPVLVERFTAEGEAYLTDVEQKYVHTPYVGVHAGFLLH